MRINQQYIICGLEITVTSAPDTYHSPILAFLLGNISIVLAIASVVGVLGLAQILFSFTSTLLFYIIVTVGLFVFYERYIGKDKLIRINRDSSNQASQTTTEALQHTAEASQHTAEALQPTAEASQRTYEAPKPEPKTSKQLNINNRTRDVETRSKNFWRFTVGGGGGVRVLEDRTIATASSERCNASLWGRELSISRGEYKSFTIEFLTSDTACSIGTTSEVNTLLKVWYVTPKNQILAYGGYRHMFGVQEDVKLLKQKGCRITVHVDLRDTLGSMWIALNGKEIGLRITEEHRNMEETDETAKQSFLKKKFDQQKVAKFQFYPPLYPYVSVYNGGSVKIIDE